MKKQYKKILDIWDNELKSLIKDKTLPKELRKKYALYYYEFTKRFRIKRDKEIKLIACKKCGSLDKTIRKKGDFVYYICKDCGYREKVYIGSKNFLSQKT